MMAEGASSSPGKPRQKKYKSLNIKYFLRKLPFTSGSDRRDITLTLGADLQPERHWTVIGQRDLHVSAETALSDRCVRSLRQLQQVIKKHPPLRRRRCAGKTRPQAFAGIRCQRELRNQQYTAADIAHR